MQGQISEIRRSRLLGVETGKSPLTYTLENGASIGAKTCEGETPLHVAAREEKSEMVQLLLVKGAAIDELSFEHQTPLYVATYHSRGCRTFSDRCWCGRQPSIRPSRDAVGLHSR